MLEINFNSNLWEQLFQFNLDAWYKTLFHHNWKGSWIGDKENSIFDQHHNIGRPIEKITLTSSVKISALLWKRISDDGAGITPYRTTDVATRILLFSSTELLKSVIIAFIELSKTTSSSHYEIFSSQPILEIFLSASVSHRKKEIFLSETVLDRRKNILLSVDPWNILIDIGPSLKEIFLSRSIVDQSTTQVYILKSPAWSTPRWWTCAPASWRFRPRRCCLSSTSARSSTCTRCSNCRKCPTCTLVQDVQDAQVPQVPQE